jgi:hypothetical protein
MADYLLTTLRSPRFAFIKDAGLWLRGCLYLGWRYQCPCCNWRLRAFVGKSGVWKSTSDGYCPRCNAKARHRRQCIFMEQQEGLFSPPVRLLEVAPWRSMSRWFNAKSGLRYIGLDLVRTGPHVTITGDVSAIPLPDKSCDIVFCSHVLEHVVDDVAAIAELHRVLQPGGRAIISVPMQFEQATIEDPSVTDPAARKLLFGEEDHVRFYGADIFARLETAGFRVELDLASELAEALCRRHGLRRDENIFFCEKPLNT